MTESLGFQRSPEAALTQLQSLAPMALPEGLWAELAAAHLKPQRAYHHLGHVAELAEHWAAIQAAGLWGRPEEAFLAALFHDAVYRPGRKDNEAKSAELAAQALARWCPEGDWDLVWVQATIRLTARHGGLQAEEVDPDQALFLDADMAILAAPWPEFQAYDVAIRQEYGHVPGFLYWRGRRAFLQGLLGSSPIYLSAWGMGRWETGARANLHRALATG